MQLILVPTRFEYGFLPSLDFLGAADVVEFCGLGPIVAAARTSQLIVQLRPERVWLVGIAGAYPGGPSIGQAHEFDRIACYGIGVGDSSDFMTCGQVGWKAWEGPLHPSSDCPLTDDFGDTIALQPGAHGSAEGCLLTVLAAAAHTHDMHHRREHFPDASAEDMEAYGVAVACRLAGTPLRVIRGMSNLAGNRDKSLWQVAEAMEAAAEMLRELYCQDASS